MRVTEPLLKDVYTFIAAHVLHPLDYIVYSPNPLLRFYTYAFSASDPAMM